MNDLMDWSNLTINKCPKCSKDLAEAKFPDAHLNTFECSCGFRISEKRYKEIVTSMEKQALVDDDRTYPDDDMLWGDK